MLPRTPLLPLAPRAAASPCPPPFTHASPQSTCLCASRAECVMTCAVLPGPRSVQREMSVRKRYPLASRVPRVSPLCAPLAAVEPMLPGGRSKCPCAPWGDRGFLHYGRPPMHHDVHGARLATIHCRRLPCHCAPWYSAHSSCAVIPAWCIMWRGQSSHHGSLCGGERPPLSCGVMMTGVTAFVTGSSPEAGWGRVGHAWCSG